MIDLKRYINDHEIDSYIVAVSFIGGGKPEDLVKTTNLTQTQVTDKLYHIIVYTLPWSRFELTLSVVIDTGCIGSCKSNYHTITAMTWRHIAQFKIYGVRACSYYNIALLLFLIVHLNINILVWNHSLRKTKLLKWIVYKNYACYVFIYLQHANLFHYLSKCFFFYLNINILI